MRMFIEQLAFYSQTGTWSRPAWQYICGLDIACTQRIWSRSVRLTSSDWCCRVVKGTGWEFTVQASQQAIQGT